MIDHKGGDDLTPRSLFKVVAGETSLLLPPGCKAFGRLQLMLEPIDVKKALKTLVLDPKAESKHEIISQVSSP